MAKRGAKPKGEYAGKSGVLSTRIRQDTRDALQSAKNQSGRSLSQEIEYRLRRSFDEDENIKDKFGTRQNYTVMRALSHLARSMKNPDLSRKEKKDPDTESHDWLSDPYTFECAFETMLIYLSSIRPEGDVIEPKNQANNGQSWDQTRAVLRVLTFAGAVRDADPSIPLLHRSSAQHYFSILKDGLGEIEKRTKLHPGEETSLDEVAEGLNLDKRLKPKPTKRKSRKAK